MFVFPFSGAVLYLLFGEYRLGSRRAARAAAYRKTFSDRSTLLLLDACRNRSALERFAEDTARLAGPVL